MSSPEVRSSLFDIGSEAKPDDLSLANKNPDEPMWVLYVGIHP